MKYKMVKVRVEAALFLSLLNIQLNDHEVKLNVQLFNSTSDRLRLGATLLTQNNGFYPESTDVLCWWDRHRIDTQPIGCPINKEIIQDKYIFYVEGFFNSYEACYSFLKANKEPRYSQAIQNLKIMFKIEYPGKKLKDAMDWRLITGNGGNISIKEARANNTIYRFSGNVYMIPAIIEFRKIENI